MRRIRGFQAFLVIVSLALAAKSAWGDETNLVQNPDFKQHTSNSLPGYQLAGDYYYRYLTNPNEDTSGYGIAFGGASDRQGSISQTVKIDPKTGRWYRFAFRGLPQENFVVPRDGLYMRVEFFGDGGKTSYDGKQKELFPLIEQARKDLDVNGDQRSGGSAVWRDYVLDFYVPFLQVDELKLSVGFDSTSGTGHGRGNDSAPSQWRRGGGPRFTTSGDQFLVTDFSLTHLTTPIELLRDAPATRSSEPIVMDSNVIPIGGRWYYRAKPGESHAPAMFDYSNSDRLLYREGSSYEAPFADNMSAWLRAGDKDLLGSIVQTDRLIADNVTVRFDETSMIVHTHGIPNHPTGKFPEPRGGNPNYIQEQNETFYFPLNPKVNPRHISTDTTNTNHALNMGPIGMAVNGVVFFNPFDAGSMDASSLMDRCCGHPNQDNLYHYHKYPICINSPWSDEGNAHSPLIGFAFDGFPIYGPYESKGVMAKDLSGPSALNSFNLHFDPDRGWHYHVTPGKFPYVIGGYWGTVDSRDVMHRGGPRGGRGGAGGFAGGQGGFGGGPGPGMGGPGFGGPGDGPPQ